MLTNNWLIQQLNEIDSTQNYAKNLNILDKQIAILAKKQTAGYGQNGKQWKSSNENLNLSLILPHDTHKPEITIITSVILGRVILSLNSNLFLQHKWVNDILIDQKKVAGILIEQMQNKLIIGIGCNLKNHPWTTTNLPATNLSKYGIDITAVEFCNIFLQEFTKLYNLWLTNGFAFFRKEWKSRAYKLNELIYIQQQDSIISGIFFDLDENGKLILSQDKKLIGIMSGCLLKIES